MSIFSTLGVTILYPFGTFLLETETLEMWTKVFENYRKW